MHDNNRLVAIEIVEAGQIHRGGYFLQDGLVHVFGPDGLVALVADDGVDPEVMARGLFRRWIAGEIERDGPQS